MKLDGDDRLKQDYAYLQRLLHCHTCVYSNKTKLYRKPCCENKDRVNFAISGHDAQIHGKCPSHKIMRDDKIQEARKLFYNVYLYGEAALIREKALQKEQSEGINELHKHLKVGLI